MRPFNRVISASLSPNTDAKDVWIALGTLVRPWAWVHGKRLGDIDAWFRETFGVKGTYLYNSGRTALLELLKAGAIGAGDEVIVQAFTCVAVPNSVIWSGATPVYADIDGTLNIDPRSVESKISARTKAIIVQHTFGIPAAMDKISAVAKAHNLLLIEDCAHALGATYKGKALGTFGDAAFFSFGRDKVVSSVWGGAAIVNPHSGKKDMERKLGRQYGTLPTPSRSWVFRQLLHPIAFAVILPLYMSGIGKLLLVILQKAGLLSIPVYPQEKKARQPDVFPARYANGLAELLIWQLRKLPKMIDTRRKNAREYAKALMKLSGDPQRTYRDGAAYLRFPVSVANPGSLIANAKRNGVLLGNWYHNVIDPIGTDFGAVSYTLGSCPRAEEAARHVINLPTLIAPDQLSRVCELLEESYERKLD